MIKTLLIMRFGDPMPLHLEKRFIPAVIDPESLDKTYYAQVTGGIISIINTVLSAKEMTEFYKKLSEKHGVPLPVMIIELGAKEADFYLDSFPNMKQLFDILNIKKDSVVEVEPLTCILSLDELLDLVNTKGIQNLTAEELSRLNQLSENK